MKAKYKIQMDIPPLQAINIELYSETTKQIINRTISKQKAKIYIEDQKVKKIEIADKYSIKELTFMYKNKY